jgi:CAAX protease family protein
VQMNLLLARLKNSPVALRSAPFALFLALTFCQGLFGEAGRYWFYLIKTVVGAWMIWIVHPLIAEMRWTVSWGAVAAGIGVFVFWVGLDSLYPTVDELVQEYLCPVLKSIGLESWCPKARRATPWNPFNQFASEPGLGWLFVVVRIAGSSFVVPPLEEVFYRSFLYRYIAKPNFQEIPLGQFRWRSFLITAIIFGFAHREWLAGILCGLAYQGLVCWKNRLGDAITAHAITNLLLGLWVVWKDDWIFW